MDGNINATKENEKLNFLSNGEYSIMLLYQSGKWLTVKQLHVFILS